jgi:hypothetical protein
MTTTHLSWRRKIYEASKDEPIDRVIFRFREEIDKKISRTTQEILQGYLDVLVERLDRRKDEAD